MFEPPGYGTFPDVSWTTADLCDAALQQPEWDLQVVQHGLRSYGGRSWYFGPAVTVVEQPDHAPSLLPIVSSPGQGRVLVVKGIAGSRHALLGDRMAGLAVQNGWAGIILDAHVRDCAALRRMPLGIHALGTLPNRATVMKPARTGGSFDLYGAHIAEGRWVYADEDGIIVLARRHTEVRPTAS